MQSPVKTEKENELALERIYDLMQKNNRSKAETDELELLSILVENFEKKNYPIEPPHPLEAIRIRMDQLGINHNDLAKIIGQRSRVSEIFNGQRKLTINMIRQLRKHLHISADVLIAEEPDVAYKAKRKKKN